MEYFVSHLGIIFIAGAFVAACAVAWWYLTERNARLIRQRAEARRRTQTSQDQTMQAQHEDEKND